MSRPATVALTIDGRPVRAAEGTNVLRAADGAGIEIPHFCYHPAFEAEGSCRMCLVEIEGLPKLELACSTLVREGMIVRTATPRVLEARRDVLEFFLAEHPLDCPICDKAGECLLQDHYDRHGRFPGRFLEPKEKRGKLVPIEVPAQGHEDRGAGGLRAGRPVRDRDLRRDTGRQRLFR